MLLDYIEGDILELVKQLVNNNKLDISRGHYTVRYYFEQNNLMYYDSLEYILQNTNIDFNSKDDYDKTFYDYALESGNQKIINLIKNIMDNSLDIKCALD